MCVSPPSAIASGWLTVPTFPFLNKIQYHDESYVPVLIRHARPLEWEDVFSSSSSRASRQPDCCSPLSFITDRYSPSACSIIPPVLLAPPSPATPVSAELNPTLKVLFSTSVTVDPMALRTASVVPEALDGEGPGETYSPSLQYPRDCSSTSSFGGSRPLSPVCFKFEEPDDEYFVLYLPPKKSRGKLQRKEPTVITATDEASSPVQSQEKKPRGRRNPWTLDEEKAFLAGLKKYNQNWAMIRAEFLKNRSRKQIYTHHRYFTKAFTNNQLVKSGGDGLVRRVGILGRPAEESEPKSKGPEYEDNNARMDVLREIEAVIMAERKQNVKLDNRCARERLMAEEFEPIGGGEVSERVSNGC